ncbi:MAG: hypothetical protein IPM36_00465 [Lewinellaceae bacterium]|nr:hypothetical protein [Lewinellaceae bacterium]
MPASLKLRSFFRAALPLMGLFVATSLHALSSKQTLAFHVSTSGKHSAESVAPDIIPLLCLGLEIVWVGIVATVGVLVWNEMRRPLSRSLSA